MNQTLRPRRSKFSKTPLPSSPYFLCGSTSSSPITPTTPSALTGSPRSLAIGRLGISPREGKKQNKCSEESVEELTVSLSRSSFGWSPECEKSPYPANSDNNRCQCERGGSFQEPDGRFLDDSFPQSPARERISSSEEDDEASFPRPLSDDEPSIHVTIEPSASSIQEDFMTAYTSEVRGMDRDYDHVEASTPKRHYPFSSSKVKVTKLQIPSGFTYSDNNVGDQSTSSHEPDQHETSKWNIRKELEYWSSVVTDRSMAIGILHCQTAEAFMMLGHAHMRLNEHHEALTAFHSSCKIFKALNGPSHLSVGRSLDAFGLAALRYNKEGGTSYLIQAKTALEEAFAIRFHNLGIWHVDTVETFNKIACVYLHMRMYREAADAYREVFLVRKAIYGVNHPSVAISAHGLAKVLIKMNFLDEAVKYFRLAINIYKKMGLPSHHPTVQRVLKDRRRLEEIRGRTEFEL